MQGDDLDEVGRYGDTQAKVSAYDVTGGSRALVDALNAEPGLLPRDGTRATARAAADRILRRHGLVGPNAGGWYAGTS